MHSPQDNAVSNPCSNPDVLVHDAGTLFSFCPLTARAKSWMDEHVQPDAQWFGPRSYRGAQLRLGLGKKHERRRAGAGMKPDRIDVGLEQLSRLAASSRTDMTRYGQTAPGCYGSGGTFAAVDRGVRCGNAEDLET